MESLNDKTLPMKTRLQLTFSIGMLIVASAATAQPTFVEKVSRASAHFIAANDLVYFTSNDSLMRTDGTAAGTFLVRSGLRFEYSPRLFAYKDLLIFIVFTEDGSGWPADREMWRTDGTASGTFPLISSNDYDLNILGIAGANLYFSAGHPTAGSEIFKTDGTAAGTVLVKDIRPGEANSFPTPLATLGNHLFFAADDGINGRELWKTDGSSAGTVMVKDINPGPDAGITGTTPMEFDNRLYFSGITPEAGAEPWVTDGTTTGTILLKDLIPGDSSSGAIEYGLHNDGWLYFFTSTTISDDPEFSEAEVSFWRTDGSAAGTTGIKTFSTQCAYCGVNDYRIYNNQFYFFLPETPERDILYTTDGTATGTTPVFSLAGNGNFIGEMNGQLVFSELGNYMHQAIYRTNGTLTGTEVVRVLVSDRSLSPTDIVRIEDKIYFPDHDAPYDPSGGYGAEDQHQLMVSDGLTTKSIRSMGGGSYYGTQNLVDLNGLLIFTTEEIYPRQSGDYKKKIWLLDPSKPFESRGTFTLVNADTDEDIQSLTGGEVISKPEGTSFNIRYDPPNPAASVVFRHQGKVVRTETAPPFALRGDINGNYMPWTAGIAGEHKVEATPFSEPRGKGTAGPTFAINFTIVDAPPVACYASGTISWDYWGNVPRAKVSDIPLTSPPTSIDMLTSFESPQNIGSNYASRVRGFICPPATGDYIFWIASNDHSELWLSTDDDTQNRQRVAYLTRATGYREWTRFQTQQSAPVRLIAGTKYYIEALHKQGVGTDHLSVGWQLPDGTMERPIAGNRLSPFVEQSDLLSHLVVPTGGSSEIDPLVIKLETEWVEGASRYTVEVSDQMDFSGESIVVTSADDHQNKFIIKDLASATTYYARVKTDISGFGPVTTFSTRDPIARMRLWGIATYGGDNNVGTLFSYSVDDNTFVKHYDQPVYWDGYYNEERLMGNLVPGPDGIFYGHREQNYGSGMFEMDAQGNVEWWEGGSAYFYESQLLLASNNHIYSTTADNWVPGIVDEYDIDERTLLLDSRMELFTQFSDPHRPLIECDDGYLYGVAGRGGVNDGGYLYKFRLDGSGFKIIHYFHDVNSGMKPYAGLVEHDGFLYGITSHEGEHGHGTIFRIRHDGTSFSKLHDFNGANGSAPRGELIVLNDVLYGTTDLGGTSGQGTVFRINQDGSGFSVLHSFNGTDGSDPSRGLVHDRNENLYGMTSYGGVNNMGVIFRVGIDGTGFTKLFDFSIESGGVPDAALIIREDTYQQSPGAQSAREIAIVNATIHPNPSTDYFNLDIQASPSETIQLVVTDQYGAAVRIYDILPGAPMQFGEDLKRGLYIVKLIQGKEVTMYRLVKK